MEPGAQARTLLHWSSSLSYMRHWPHSWPTQPRQHPQAGGPSFLPTAGNTEAQNGKLPVQYHPGTEKAEVGLKPSGVTLMSS